MFLTELQTHRFNVCLPPLLSFEVSAIVIFLSSAFACYGLNINPDDLCNGRTR